MKQLSARTAALLLTSSLTILPGCSSSTSDETGLDDSNLDDVSSSTTPVFLPYPSPPYPQSSSSEVLSKAAVFKATHDSFMAGVFQQINDVYRDISLGEESSSDPDIAIMDAEFYDSLLSKCTLGFSLNGTDIDEINCPGLAFLNFHYRHAIYEQMTVQLRTGIFQSDGLTSLRYEMKVFQFSGIGEDQLSVKLNSDDELNLSYGFLNSLDCDSISVAASDVHETNLSPCALSLDFSNTVITRLMDGV